MKKNQEWISSARGKSPMPEVDPKYQPRLQNLALLRGEDVNTLRQNRPDLQLKTIPAKIKPTFMAVKELEIEESGIDDGMPFVRLPSGRIFFGLPQPLKCGFIYDAIQDLLPKKLVRECMLLARDVVLRYKKVNFVNLIPHDAEVVLEVGAYHGIKAIRFLEQMGGKGQVVAIEIMPENLRVLERNIEANGLGDQMQAVLAGAWNQAERKLVPSDGYQKNSVLPIDGRPWSNNPSIEVSLDTLDNIIETYGLKRIDFINFQINGAESEALEGLQRNIDRVGVLRVVAPYSREGEKSLPACEKRLSDLGCQVLLRRKRCLIATPSARVEEYSWIKDL